MRYIRGLPHGILNDTRVTAAAGALVAALMREPRVAACASESGKTPAQYVAGGFSRREVTLSDGAQMTVVVATDSCLAYGAATKIIILKETGDGYRRVLDALTLPGLFAVRRDGTVTLPTHESMETILESEYIWNGSSYAFSPWRSQVYDVPLGLRRAYRTPVRFRAGTSATTIVGSAALNFGQSYLFEARAAGSVTVELTKFSGRRPGVSLWLGEKELAVREVSPDRWSARIAKSGTYQLDVFATNESDETRLSTYAIRLSIRR